MFDANEWKVANDLTVEDLITYMKNHFNPKAKVNIDGDEIFHIHAELDGSAISFDTSSGAGVHVDALLPYSSITSFK